MKSAAFTAGSQHENCHSPDILCALPQTQKMIKKAKSNRKFEIVARDKTVSPSFSSSLHYFIIFDESAVILRGFLFFW